MLLEAGERGADTGQKQHGRRLDLTEAMSVETDGSSG